MTWTLAGSLVTLRSEFDRAHPNRPKASDGTVGDLSHQARASDHNPDANGVVRAWDCTAIDETKPHPLAVWIAANRPPRVKYVISRGQIMKSYTSSSGPAWTWLPYHGINGHFHHCHVSVTAAPWGDDPAPWGYPNGVGTHTTTTPNYPEKGALMALTDSEQTELLAKVRELHMDYGKTNGVGGPMRELLKSTRDRVNLLAKKAGII